jgi:histidyl-tRNA synthetase
MICQLFANLKRKKRGVYDILAGGGRFDTLISSFSSRLNIAEQDRNGVNPPCGVGISIGLDALAAAIQEDDLEDKALPD